MGRRVFINELKKALANELSKDQIQAQVTYYTDYIDAEMAKGRVEEEVIGDLGDPFALAQNIIAMEPQEESSQEANGTYESESEAVGQQGGSYGGNFGGNTMQWNVNSRWGCWIAFIVFAFVVVGVIALLFNVIQFLLPVLVPFVLIMFILNFFQKKS